jgi:hypothetical protein
MMRDPSGRVRADAEARARTHDDGQTRVSPWLGGGRVKPLEITLDRMSEFDMNNYAGQIWTHTGASLLAPGGEYDRVRISPLRQLIPGYCIRCNTHDVA